MNKTGITVIRLSFCFPAWLFCLWLRNHVLQHYDGLKAQRFSPRLVPSDGGQHGYIEMLDELTLEHMTQDCSLLKNQLLRLKTLLQVWTHSCSSVHLAAKHPHWKGTFTFTFILWKWRYLCKRGLPKIPSRFSALSFVIVEIYFKLVLNFLLLFSMYVHI